MPRGVTWLQVLGVGILGGIGFTVSLLISGLAFDDEALVAAGKLGILAASIVAGLAGYVVLRIASTARAKRVVDSEPVASQ